MAKRKPKKQREVKPCPKQKITTCGGKYYYDEEAADKVIKFFSLLKHTKTPFTGQPFVPQQWQEHDFLRPLFGWKRASDGTRRFRRCFLGIPKKNGKSALCSGICNYLLMGDCEYGAEVYCAANERGQAGIVFNESKAQLKMSPLAKYIIPNPIKDSTKILTFSPTASKYAPLSSESSTKDGMSIHGLVIDELHAMKDPSLFYVLTQGSGAARRQPLHIFITTAGTDRNSVCFGEYEAAKQVIKDERYDEELLGVIYEAEKGDDWTDPRVWKKANPSLGITITEDSMRHDCDIAQKRVSTQNEFKRLRLNIWTSQITRWLNRSDWDRAGRKYSETDLRGLPCYGGLDMSSTLDLTAFMLAFPKEDGVYLWPYIFIPEERIIEAEKRDKVPYSRWVAEGKIYATPGNTQDLGFLMSKIDEANALFSLQSVSFDPWQAAAAAAEMAKRNISGIAVAQNYSGMSLPTKEFERLLISKRLYHPENECLTWGADNIEVRNGPNGVILPNKPAEKAGQQKRIDPIVGSILAIERISRGVKPKKSVYSERGIEFF